MLLLPIRLSSLVSARPLNIFHCSATSQQLALSSVFSHSGTRTSPPCLPITPLPLFSMHLNRPTVGRQHKPPSPFRPTANWMPYLNWSLTMVLVPPSPSSPAAPIPPLPSVSSLGGHPHLPAALGLCIAPHCSPHCPVSTKEGRMT